MIDILKAGFAVAIGVTIAIILIPYLILKKILRWLINGFKHIFHNT